MYEVQKGFKGLGFLVDLAISSVEATAMGVSYAIQRDATDKNIKSTKNSQRQLLMHLEDVKQKELAVREKGLAYRIQTELLSNLSTKQLVLYSSITVVGLAILGTVIFVKVTDAG